MRIDNLKEIIKLNKNFKTSINLYLSLNKPEKINAFIPTKSSITLLNDFVISVLNNREQANLLIGPYGKGKSHLLLVLLSIISLKRNEENQIIIKRLVEKIASVDVLGEEVANNIIKLWNQKKRFLPVVLNNTHQDLNQAFLIALNDALKREQLSDLIPDTYYSIAIEKLKTWEKDYPTTYDNFGKELCKLNMSIAEMKVGLAHFSKDALDKFSFVFPLVTSGSEFNPLAYSSVLGLYKSVSEKLAEDYGFDGIYIVFDEFSKFIEGQNHLSTGPNMELLQEMCELATDSANAQVHLTMVAHKSIKEYGTYLSQEIINSFTGIEGRLIEKYFITSSKNNYELIKNAIIKDDSKLDFLPNYQKLIGSDVVEQYYSLPTFRSNFTLDDFEKTVVRGCYPLTPVSAYLLLNISEKVAQNERTLFTFISNDEPNSMARFVENHTSLDSWTIGADLIYDYFSLQLKKDVTSEMAHNIWLSAEYALSKCAREDEKIVVKTLAVMLIVNKEDEMPADEKYLPLAANISNASEVVETLTKKELIYRKKSTGCYVFKTKAGSALKNEIKKLQEVKGENVNYSEVLLQVSGIYNIIPRRYNAKKCITRYFKHEYMNYNEFMNINSAHAFFDRNDNADGKVISLYDFEEIDHDEVKRHFKELECQNLVLSVPSQRLDIRNQLRDYEILQDIKSNQIFNDNNTILKKEIPLLEDDISRDVERILSQLYWGDDCEIIYLDKNDIVSLMGKSAETAVNRCCEILFYKSPIINNELINKTIISSPQTKKSRLNIIKAVLSHTDTESFYEGTSQDATIYRSLFCQTGITKGKLDEELNSILTIINMFLDSCCDDKKNLSELIDILSKSPYGVRAGVIPIYFAYVISKRKEDIVIYFTDYEIPIDEETVVNMCSDPGNYALFVSREDIEKERYISNLNSLFNVEESRNLTENRIKDILICMQRWFRALPQVTRNTVEISTYISNPEIERNMLSLKRHLQKVDSNPFEILFVLLPKEFGSKDNLNETYEVISNCFDAYQAYFEWFQNKVVESIYDVFDSKRKNDLFHALKEWFDNQSSLSKQGLHSNKISSLMTCIEGLNVYNDSEVAQKIAKATSDIYIENWTTNTFEEFTPSLGEIKSEIEALKDLKDEGKLKLSFTGKSGDVINRYYDQVDENTGSVLRNIIEDTLDEFDDMSVNDRVAILLEMIEKTIG